MNKVHQFRAAVLADWSLNDGVEALLSRGRLFYVSFQKLYIKGIIIGRLNHDNHLVSFLPE